MHYSYDLGAPLQHYGLILPVVLSIIDQLVEWLALAWSGLVDALGGFLILQVLAVLVSILVAGYVMSQDIRWSQLPISTTTLIKIGRCDFYREETLHKRDPHTSEPGIDNEFDLGLFREADAAAEGGGEVRTGRVVSDKVEDEGEKDREEGEC